MPELQLTAEQQSAIHRAACQIVAAAASGSDAQIKDELLSGSAESLVDGAFVTLKHDGKLRGCYGSHGGPTPLNLALKNAAIGAAIKDPRFPNLEPNELIGLHLEVSLLHDIQTIVALGADRAAEISIGKHGLVIRRGEKSGLLLPCVAVDWKLDTEGFLRQTCRKAGLADRAWTERDSTLQTFQADCFGGPFVTDRHHFN